MIKQELKDRVIAWAEARNFFGDGGATVEGQLAKLLEEASELVTDIVRGRDATDSVGDCLVVLTILERMGAEIRWGQIGLSNSTPLQNAAYLAQYVCTMLRINDKIIAANYLVAASDLLNIDPNHALSVALAEIEPRRGSWSGGVFVKEAK